LADCGGGVEKKKRKIVRDVIRRKKGLEIDEKAGSEIEFKCNKR
jgi:hypothetical protein